MAMMTKPKQQKTHPVVYAGRFVSGREMTGEPKTNARWAQRGTKPLTPTGYASRWHHYPHRRRAGVRLAAVTSVLLLAMGAVMSPFDTQTTLRVVAWILLLTGAWATIEKSRRWSHYQTYVVPTARALGDLLGIPRQTDPRLWVHVPSDHRTNPDKQVIIDLPDAYNATTQVQKRLGQVAMKYLGMKAPTIEWPVIDGKPFLTLQACPEPPELVTFEHVRELAELAAPDEFVMGLGARMTPNVVSLSGDSPHVMASIGSGGGKSNFGKWTALQAYRRGARIVIIDIVKRGASHKWAKGIDGIEIYRHPDVAHDALLELYDLVEDRCESYWHNGPSDDQQILLIIEESNRTLRKLQSHWVNNLSGTKTSPAVLAIEGTLCVGREAGVNAVTVGQRMSAAASGGGDARENYGVRLGNRFSRQTARMLFGDCNPLPQSSNHPGRIQVVIGAEANECQVPRLKDIDPAPLEWAIAGRRAWFEAHPDTGHSGDSTPADQGIDQGQETAEVVSLLTAARRRRNVAASVGDPADEPGGVVEVEAEDGPDAPDTAAMGGLVTLAQAAKALGTTVVALRNARHKDTDFPPARGNRGAAKLYRPDELEAWDRNRERRGQGAAAEGEGN